LVNGQKYDQFYILKDYLTKLMRFRFFVVGPVIPSYTLTLELNAMGNVRKCLLSVKLMNEIP